MGSLSFSWYVQCFYIMKAFYARTFLLARMRQINSFFFCIQRKRARYIHTRYSIRAFDVPLFRGRPHYLLYVLCSKYAFFASRKEACRRTGRHGSVDVNVQILHLCFSPGTDGGRARFRFFTFPFFVLTEWLIFFLFLLEKTFSWLTICRRQSLRFGQYT